MDSSIIGLILTGLAAGLSAGLFGIGGGVIIVPALVYLLHFTQHKALGTSLAVLLPPFGIAAVYEYYKKGNVDIKAAAIIGAALFFGGWVGGYFANRMSGPHLKLAFGIFYIVIGIYTIATTLPKLKAGN